MNFPDGLSGVASMRLLSHSTVPRRVHGPSVLRAVLQDGASQDLRHLLAGTTPPTLDELANAVRATYPGVKVVGAYSPPLGLVDDTYLDDLVSRLSDWDTDIVWVGLGTPKQDSSRRRSLRERASWMLAFLPHLTSLLERRRKRRVGCNRARVDLQATQGAETALVTLSVRRRSVPGSRRTSLRPRRSCGPPYEFHSHDN